MKRKEQVQFGIKKKQKKRMKERNLWLDGGSHATGKEL